MSCHGNRIFYSRRCSAFRTISLPGFNGLCCKLTEIALFIISYPDLPRSGRGEISHFDIPEPTEIRVRDYSIYILDVILS